jgi:hypothetical protein
MSTINIEVKDDTGAILMSKHLEMANDSILIRNRNTGSVIKKIRDPVLLRLDRFASRKSHECGSQVAASRLGSRRASRRPDQRSAVTGPHQAFAGALGYAVRLDDDGVDASRRVGASRSRGIQSLGARRSLSVRRRRSL